ncbi:MAG: tetratricopeptide repeat protein [Pirellulaceae bacterium]|nr:tetratricopeptide repeat protein [Pirellulaceae bacterium]
MASIMVVRWSTRTKIAAFVVIFTASCVLIQICNRGFQRASAISSIRAAGGYFDENPPTAVFDSSFSAWPKLAMIRDLTSISYWEAETIPDSAIHQLVELPELKHLRICVADLPPSSLRHLRDSSSIKKLRLQIDNLTHEHLVELRSFRELEMLDVCASSDFKMYEGSDSWHIAEKRVRGFKGEFERLQIDFPQTVVMRNHSFVRPTFAMSEDSSAVLSRVRAAIRDDQADDVESLLIDAIKKESNAYELRSLLIHLYLHQGRKEQALEVSTVFIEDFPWDGDSLLWHASMLSERGRHREAITALTAAMRRVNLEQRYYLWRGNLYYRTENPELALADYNRAKSSSFRQPASPTKQLMWVYLACPDAKFRNKDLAKSLIQEVETELNESEKALLQSVIAWIDRDSSAFLDAKGKITNTELLADFSIAIRRGEGFYTWKTPW